MISPPYDARSNTPVWLVCVAAALGIALGSVLTHFHVHGDYISWIALPGDLFIRALQCLITPMVFCSVVVVIAELVEAGEAASIGARTVACFGACSLLSSSIGVAAGYGLSDLFSVQVKPVEVTPIARVLFQCSGADGRVLSMMNTESDSVLACLAANATANSNSSLFQVTDATGYFAVDQQQATAAYTAARSVSDQIFAILSDLVPDNVLGAFAQASTLSALTFALCFGLALAKSVDRTRDGENYPLLLIVHANVICRMLVNKIVAVIPVAIVSMIAGAIAQFATTAVSTDGAANALAILESVGWFVVVLAGTLAFLTLGILGALLFLTTRRNVVTYLAQLVPAHVFVVGCSSSLATLPVTLRCVESAKEVSPALARFVLPLGATCNLNGSALYLTLACVFMAKVGGFEEQLTPITGALLALVGAIASFGVAPVPHSGLVLVLTVWRTVFDLDVPPAFSVLVGLDWLLDRLRTLANVSNAAVLCRVLAAQQCDRDAARELERLGLGSGVGCSQR